MKLDEMDDDQRITMTVASLKQALREEAHQERQACAQLCEERAHRIGLIGTVGSALASLDCAAAIRARGQ